VEQTFEARNIHVGYHPQGYRIDRTASPMNRYTRWRIAPDGRWGSPEPVCFDSMPRDGWLKAELFDWEAAERTEGER
jgi:hypothetical protein